MQRAKNEHKVATVIGSYIVFILNSMIPINDKSHASTIRLKQALLGKLRKVEVLDLIPIADQTWLKVAEGNSGTSVLPSTVIETLFFNHYDEMLAMYGNHIGDLVTRYVSKHQNNLHTKDSYNIADALSKAVIEAIK